MRRLEKVLFVSSMLVSSFFLALASLAAVSDQPLIIFGSSLLSWIGYLNAHKTSAGTYIDGKEDEESMKMIPREPRKWAGSITGSIILVSGMVIGVGGLRQRSLGLTFLAAIVFMTGYVIAHYSATEELL